MRKQDRSLKGVAQLSGNLSRPVVHGRFVTVQSDQSTHRARGVGAEDACAVRI